MVSGEIYTECENLFYYLKRDIEIKNDTVFKYLLKPEDDTVRIESVNLDNNRRTDEIKRMFTPYGVKEFLKFRGFLVKEIWGDLPYKKVTFNTKTLLIRMVKYGN